MDNTADIGIVGTGTMGAMAAWQLARRGASVMAFEQFAPGHDQAAAGGESRIFRTAYHEGTEYVPLLVAARNEWRKLESDAGRKLLTLNGFLTIGDRQCGPVQNVLRAKGLHDLDCRELTSKELAKEYPQHRISDDDCAIFDPAGGVIRPELAVAFAADNAKLRGSKVSSYDPVVRIDPDDNGVTVVSRSGRYRFRKVVISTGPWGAGSMGLRGPKTTPNRIVMTWFPARHPEKFQPDRFPPFVRYGFGTVLCGWPSLDGYFVKVAVVYPYDEIADPAQLNRTVAPELLSVVEGGVAEALPDLIPHPTRIGVYMDGYTADGHGVVGSLPDSPNVIVAYGFSGHGFKLSPIIGRAISDLALDDCTELPIQHLSPSRDLSNSAQTIRYVSAEIEREGGRLH